MDKTVLPNVGSCAAVPHKAASAESKGSGRAVVSYKAASVARKGGGCPIRGALRANSPRNLTVRRQEGGPRRNERIIVDVSKFLLLTLLFTLISLPQVHALGVTPGRRTIDFEPGHTENVPITISNNEHKDMRLVISARGELAQYISLSDVLVEMTAGDEKKDITYTVTLPQSLDPGTRSGEVVIMEVPSKKDGEGTFMGATVSVVTELKVRVPYKGKYAEVGLEVSEGKVGETTTFIVPVSNLGEEDILKAKGTVDILGPTNEKIATVQTDEQSIKSKETKELLAPWVANVNPGKYYATATLDYDGLQQRADKVFTVGDLSIDLTDVTVKDFRLGGIAKFDMTVQNKWNEDLKDVYIEMTIVSDKGDPVASLKSSTEAVPALGKMGFSVFWDTDKVPQGAYSTKVVVHYNDKSMEKQSKIVVTLDSIVTTFTQVTGQVVQTGKGSNLTVILIVAVTVLVIINVGWFLYMKKRRQ